MTSWWFQFPNFEAQHTARLSVNVINNLKPRALATTKRELNLINLQFGAKNFRSKTLIFTTSAISEMNIIKINNFPASTTGL